MTNDHNKDAFKICARSLEDGRTFLFNDTLNTFYLRLYGVGHMIKDNSDRAETRCRHYMDYTFRLAARVLLCASSHREDSTYHSLCYTSRGTLTGTRSTSLMGTS